MTDPHVELSCHIGVLTVISPEPHSDLAIRLPSGLWAEYQAAVQSVARVSHLISTYLSDSEQHLGPAALVYAELAAMFDEEFDAPEHAAQVERERQRRAQSGPDNTPDSTPDGGPGRGCGR